jgi:LysM repeat protein
MSRLSLMDFFKGRMPLLLIAGGILFVQAAEAAPRRYVAEEDAATTMREMRDTLDDIKHEVSNHESEIRMFEEKLNNQELTIDGLRQQINDTHQANKELLKGTSQTTEEKISNLESTTKSLVSDLRQFKSHANETTTALAQYKQKLSELEKIIEVQNQSLDNMQAALRSLVDAMQVQGGASSASVDKVALSDSKLYRVKNGDSLEKIARANQTTVKAIKELNGLANDRIIVGQRLQLP